MSITTVITTVEELQNEWANPYVQWHAAGMPTFVTVNKAPWKQISVKFKTMEDRQAFAKLLEFNLTEKTGVVWYPLKPVEKNNMSRVTEDEPNV